MNKRFANKRPKNTSWQNVAPWYNKITRESGHYYHQHVVIPETLKLLNLRPGDKLLDIACGNGVLAHSLAKGINYLGIDSAETLIKTAQKSDKNRGHKYLVSDVTKKLDISDNFTHSTIILALQNIKSPVKALENISAHLVKNGKLVIVVNHPVFRIPRQSSWGFDPVRKIQYRRIDRYMTPMEIPINMNPSDKNSQVTMSYHFPLSDYSKMLKNSGFVIEEIAEWTSDKESVGRAAKMENRSRSEIPLFMAILAQKI